jgi:hypothetical protein
MTSDGGGGGASVIRYRLAHERKGAACLTQSIANDARFDVGDPVAKACASPGMAVMAFVRVQHEHLTGHAVLRCAPVVEGGCRES